MRLRPSEMMTAFFAAGSLYMATAAALAVAATTGLIEPERWLLLHLVFIGGISQLVFGASQFFVTAFLATEPPTRTLVRRQLGVWNLGTLLVLAGVGWGWDVAAIAGASLLGVGLGLLWHSYELLKKKSLQAARWAVRWYSAAIALFAPGVALGALLAIHVPWSHGSLLGAHLVLNLAGWFGCAIVGTLHTFYPSLTHTQLAHPRLQQPTFFAWVSGTVALAVGFGLGSKPLTLAGWVLLLAAALLLAYNLIGSIRGTERPMSLAPRLIGAAQVCLVFGLAACLVVAADGNHLNPLFGSARPPVALLLLAGWLGLTVIASLIHLLSVSLTVAEMKTLGPGRSRPGVAGPGGRLLGVLAAVGITVCAVAAGADSLGGGSWTDWVLLAGVAILASVYVVIAVKVLVVMARLYRAGAIKV